MDIVERLRAYEWREVGDIGGIPLNRRFFGNPDGPEAADEIEKLRKERNRLREALNADNQTLRLHLGEMTAQEMRTLKAGFSWVLSSAALKETE